MTLRRAAEQALEALVLWEDEAPHWWSEADAKAVAALRAALVEPEQEPVPSAWRYKDTARICDNSDKRMTAPPGWVPLYSAPPQRKPLTEEEIEQAYSYIWRNLPDDFDHTSIGWIEQGIRYAEQAHGIKGEA